LPLDLSQLAARLVSRARQVAWLAECARWSAPALFALGAVLFVARYFGDVPRADAARILVLFALVPLFAWWRARAMFLSQAGAVAWLDRASGGSGALLTQFECGDARWAGFASSAMARIEGLPRVRLTRAFLPSLLALAFVAGALWIEKPASVLGPSTHLAESRLEEVKDQLIALREIVELEPEQAQELAERIERIEENLRDAPVDASLEALDRTSDELSFEADRSLAAADRAEDRLAGADAAQSADQAQRALQDALKEMRDGGLGAKLPESIRSELLPGSLELPAGVVLSRETVAQLSSEMRADLNLKLGKLASAGLISPRQLEHAKLVERVTEHVCDDKCKSGGT
jgi:hypothetical protein